MILKTITIKIEKVLSRLRMIKRRLIRMKHIEILTIFEYGEKIKNYAGVATLLTKKMIHP